MIYTDTTKITIDQNFGKISPKNFEKSTIIM